LIRRDRQIFIMLFLVIIYMKNKKELPCLDCKHADITCGEVMCTIEGKAVHLIKICPETGEEL